MTYEPERKYNTHECDGYWIVVLDGEYEQAIDQIYHREEAAIEASEQADDLGPLDCPHCKELATESTVEYGHLGNFETWVGCVACGMRGPATSSDPLDRRFHIACGSWNQIVRLFERDERILPAPPVEASS